MSVRFGLAVPASICGFRTAFSAGDRGSPLSPAQWTQHLDVPEVDTLWALDQQLGRTPTAEPLSVLSFLAAMTTRHRLGVAVLVGASRGPVATAKGFATLDWLSGGRLDLGLGLGAPRHYPAYGVDRAKGGGAGAMLDEFIDVVRHLWQEDDVEAGGRTWRLAGARITPKPCQRPHPPLWIGGGSERSLQRAVDLGAGWIGAGRHSAPEFAGLAARLQDILAERGRPDGFTVAKRVYIVVDDDRGASGRVIAEWFGRFYNRPELGAAVTVAGSASACAEQLAVLVEAGADHLILHPLEDDPDQYDALTGDVIPAVMAASRPAA